MSVLALDIGNTRTKWAIFHKEKRIQFGFFDVCKAQIQLEALISVHQIERIIFVCVKDKTPSWLETVSNNVQVQAFNLSLPAPVQNAYLSSETLGLDRWAAVLGAYQKLQNKNCIIIDAGTCITIDVLNDKGVYLGGMISPGIQMRLQAMHRFTDRLPMVEANWEAELPLFGQNTQEAIHTGALGGCLAEIEGRCAKFKQAFGEINLIFTGGDGQFLYNQLKNGIFAHHVFYEPLLVLEGIYSVIE